MHIHREFEPVLRAALTGLAGYRRPRWRAIILTGLAATGKTALAHALVDAPQVRRSFREGVLWLQGRFDPAAEVVRLVQALALAPLPGDRPGETWQRWLAEPRRRSLLVMDDVADPAAVRAFIAGLGPQVVALITTQQGRAVRAEVERWLPADQILVQPVAGLTPAEGRELVETVAGRPLTEREWAEAQAVGELLGWHAEALRLAALEGRETGWAGVLGELATGRLPWADLRATLRRQWARLPAEQQAWLTTLLPVVSANNGFTMGTAAQAWGVTPAVAGYRLWVLAQDGWVVGTASAEDSAAGWRMAPCGRLALAEVVQQAEISANKRQ